MSTVQDKYPEYKCDACRRTVKVFFHLVGLHICEKCRKKLFDFIARMD